MARDGSTRIKRVRLYDARGQRIDTPRRQMGFRACADDEPEVSEVAAVEIERYGEIECRREKKD